MERMGRLAASLKRSAPASAARWLRNTLLDGYYWPRAHGEIDRLIDTIKRPEDAVEILWQYRAGGFYRNLKPNQDKDELTRMALRIHDLAPKVIVEIGTRYGGTLLVWTNSAPAPELVVSIDLPGGIHGGGYPAARAKLYREFTRAKPGCTLELMRADSQQQSTKARLAEALGNRPIDFLFIDGDHRYDGVRRDYELYAELVRPGGLIAFHDIRVSSRDQSIQVYRLWDEIKASGKQVEEIIHEPYAGHYGIGVVTVGRTTN